MYFSLFSCTGSSCDFWPHCGVTGYSQKFAPDRNHHHNINDDIVNDDDDVIDDDVIDGRDDFDDDDEYRGGGVERRGDGDSRKCARMSESVPNLSDNSFGAKDIMFFENDKSNKNVSTRMHSNNNMHYSPFKRKTKNSNLAANNNKPKSDKKNVIKLLTNKPPIYEKTKSNSTLFLGEREMPITRERYSKSKYLVNLNEAKPNNVSSIDKATKLKVNVLMLPNNNDVKISTMPSDPGKIR